MSLLIPTLVAVEAYYSQRLDHADPEPATLDFVLPLAMPYGIFVVPSYIFLWTIIYAHMGFSGVFILLAATTAANRSLLALIRRFATSESILQEQKWMAERDRDSEDEIEAKLWKKLGELELKNAITSALTPCVPLYDGSYAMAATALSASAFQFIWMCLLLLSLEMHPHLLEQTSLTCAERDSSQNGTSAFHWICLDFECHPYRRLCYAGESGSEILWFILLRIMPSMHIVSLAMLFVLSWLSDYRHYYFALCAIHPNLVGKTVLWNVMRDFAKNESDPGNDALIASLR